MIPLRTVAAALMALVLNLFLSSLSLAQSDYPSKPIRMVVPFAAGGSTDIVARMLQPKLSEALGQPVVVENRPGAGSTIGIDNVAKSAPDGYSIVVASNAGTAPGALMRTTMPFDAIKDFAYVTLIVTFTNGVLVRGDSPIKSLAELIETARANPGKLTYSSAGVGSSGWLTGELLKRQAHIDMLHVPYKGVAPAFNDLMAGRIDFMFHSAGGHAALIRSGKLRLLAESGLKPSSTFPNVPTIDSVVPGVVGDSWFGILAPAATPEPILKRLETALTGVMRDPELRKRFAERGLEPSGAGRAEFLAYAKAENAQWGPLIKALNIKIDR